MNVMNKDVVVTRPYKVVYREGDQKSVHTRTRKSKCI